MNSEISESQIPASKSLPRPLLLVCLFVGMFAILSVAVYQLPVSNPFVRAVAEVMPYPAVLVNGSLITIGDYAVEREALLHYLESSGVKEMPKKEVMEQAILDALVNKEAIRLLARQEGVKIDTARVEKFYEEVVKSEESEEAFAKELSQTFGWSEMEFKRRIIESIVLALQMSEYVYEGERFQADAHARIDEKKRRLDAGETNVLETDLGFQSVNELPQQWSVAKDLAAGAHTNVIDFEQGFAIFGVTERIENADGAKIRLMAAMEPKKTLEDVVREYLDGADVRYFVR